MKEPPTTVKSSDHDLLHAGRSGNEEAFLCLYHRYSSSVFRFSLYMSGNRELAEEVTQDVFLALLSGDTRYREEQGTLEPFLIGIARNHIRRHHRQTQRVAAIDRSPSSTTPSFFEAADNDLPALRQAILALPEAYRAVVVLCDLEQLSYAEAAQRLHCAVGTVRSRLHRARAILEVKLRRREACQITTAR